MGKKQNENRNENGFWNQYENEIKCSIMTLVHAVRYARGQNYRFNDGLVSSLHSIYLSRSIELSNETVLENFLFKNLF